MNKGLTLIELLGVIIIIGIVLLIAVPTISNLILSTEERVYFKTESLLYRL